MNDHRHLSTALLLVALAVPAVAVAACGDDSGVTDASSGTDDDGEGGQNGDSNSAPVSVSAGSTTGASTTGSSSPTSTSTGEGAGPGVGGGDGGGGQGGSGDGGSGQGGSGQGGGDGTGGGANACEAASFGGVESAIADVWAADPVELTPFFLPGVIVTAVSLGACVGGEFCQLFVQQEETFADWDAGAQQAIHVIIAPEVASQFGDVAVGDVLDLGGSASRDTSGQRNELRFLIRESNPGCAVVVGSAAPAPIVVELDDLTQGAWETTHGPLLVQLVTVSGRPHQPGEIFALWDTGGNQGGGLEQVTNASPFFLAGGVFTGLTAETITDFASVSGVFGQFTPTGSMTKYETIYPRTMAEVDPL